MWPRIWLALGLLLLGIGLFNALQQGGFGTPYGLGYVIGSVGIGLAIIYFGWYRRRSK